MICIAENKHGNIFVHNLIEGMEVSKFKYQTYKKQDVDALRNFLSRFHSYDSKITNKVLGDLLHHGVHYRFKGETDEY